jgi:hypothetical protein
VLPPKLFPIHRTIRRVVKQPAKNTIWQGVEIMKLLITHTEDDRFKEDIGGPA